MLWILIIFLLVFFCLFHLNQSLLDLTLVFTVGLSTESDILIGILTKTELLSTRKTNMPITTRQLAKLLLESEDKPFTVSVDIAVYGKEGSYSDRCFGEGFCGLNQYSDSLTLMFEKGAVFMDNKKITGGLDG